MNNIETYIRFSIRQGKSHEEIANNLRDAGWDDNAIDQGFLSVSQNKMSENRETDNPESARLNFLYLLSFMTLYISVWAFLNTAFSSIDAMFNSSEIGSESLRWSIAFLVVVFPVFLLTNSYIRKTANKNAGELHVTSSTGRALTYITLFITVLAFIISAVYLVYELTGGDVISSSILKILTIIFVAGSLFGYYFKDVKKVDPEKGQ